MQRLWSLLGWNGVVVVVAWLAASLHLLGQVLRYTVDMPYADDFGFVEYITGDTPVTLDWLWETHNEHRMITPKLVLVALTRGAGIDFRAVPCFSVVLMSAIAAFVLLVLRKAHGRFALHHALVPLVLCSWAQSESFTWTSPFNIVLSSAAVLAWWGCNKELRLTANVAWHVSAVLAAVIAMTSGGTGVAAITGIAPWYAWMTINRANLPPVRWSSGLVGLGSVIYLGVYAMAYQRPDGHPHAQSLLQTMHCGLRLIAAPWANVRSVIDLVGVTVLAVSAILVVRGLRDWRDHDATFALLLAVCGVLGAVAVGRAGFGLDIAPRYATLGTPLVVALLALADETEPGKLVSCCLVVMAAMILLALPPHDKQGHSVARAIAQRSVAAQTRILAGESPADVLVETLVFPTREYAPARIEMLRRQNASLFRGSNPR